jgi:hypothetical protein
MSGKWKKVVSRRPAEAEVSGQVACNPLAPANPDLTGHWSKSALREWVPDVGSR